MARTDRRHPDFPERRTGNSGDGRIPAQASSAGVRNPAAVLAPVAVRAGAGVQAHRFAPHRAGDQRGGNLADRAGYPCGDRHRIRPHQPLFSHRSKLQRLPIEKISRASANQRAGRCGRVGPGIAIRLYSEAGFHRPPRVHRPGNPSHQPRGSHPANACAEAGRYFAISLCRAPG